MTPVFRPGFFTDVFCLPDGRLGQVYESGLSVVCEIEGAHAWMTPAPERLMFCRAAVHNGDVFTIHQGHDSGRALLIGGGFVKDLGLTFGVQPVAIDSRSVYVVRSSTRYDQIDLATGVVESLPSGVPGSSQGISDVVDGVLWWADLHRSLTRTGLPTLTYPNQRGAVVIGQADPPQIAGWINSARAFTAFAGDGYEPHLVQSGSRYALCARTPQGAGYLIVPPFSTIPIKVPGPIVNEPPKKEPMSTPNRLDIVRAVDAAFPHLLRQNTKASCGEFTERCALNLFMVDPDFGLLSKQPGEKQHNKHGIDSIIYKSTQQVIDIIGAAGARDEGDQTTVGVPVWNEVPKRAGNEWMHPIAVDGVVPQPDKPPPVDTGEIAQLRAIIAKLKTENAELSALHAREWARIGDLEREVETLKARPAFPTYDAMMQLGRDLNAAYRGAQKKREKDKRDMDAATVGHLFWRFLVEGYTAAALIADARERGTGA